MKLVHHHLSWIITSLIVAGILHISFVFAVPWLAEKDAWAQVTAHFPSNRLTVEKSAQAAVLPYSSPDVLHAYCPFDVSEHNLIVTTPLPDTAWSLAVSTRDGENFYVITGADVKKSEIRLLIIPKDRLPQEASTEKSEEGEDQNIVVTPDTDGIVTLRAPLRGDSFREQTSEVLARAKCEIQKPLPPIVTANSSDEETETTARPKRPRPAVDRRRKRRRPANDVFDD